MPDLSRRRFLTMRAAHAAPAAAVEGEARVARLEPGCVALRGIVCRSCGEQCEPGAIRFRLLPAGRALPVIDEARCTGCGECARVCPAQAIVLRAGPPAPQSR